MNLFIIAVCLLPLALAGSWDSSEERHDGGDKMKEWENKEKSEKMEKMKEFMEMLHMKEKVGKMMELKSYMKWKMEEKEEQKDEEHEKKEKMEKMKKMAEFMSMAEKMKKMKEIHEFMEWKKMKMSKGKQEEDEMKEHAGKFEMVLKNMKAEGHKNAMLLTHAFLGLCKCQDGMELKKMFGGMDKDGEEKSDMGDAFDADMPDIMGNMTAKAHFLKSLSKEQQKKMFGFGLVKSMCHGAKTFITKAKEFEMTYMKKND